MTKSVGPNEPCPCGSGKKFKKCCQAEIEETEIVFRRVRQIHDELIPQILPFALETFGAAILEDAWSDFYLGLPDEPFDPANPMNMLFMPWFFFNWIFEVPTDEPGTTLETNLVEEFIANSRLSREQESWLLSSVGQPFSFCEIVEVEPGIGIKIFDLLRQTEFDLIERAGSQTMKRGEILYCALTHHAGISSNMGTGPYAIPATSKREVLKIRKWMAEDSGSEEITGATLVEFAEDLREYYLEFVDSVLEPPMLVNTDGDPLVPQTVHYQVESADRAFHALKDLAVGMSSKELIADATIVDGLVHAVEFPWLGGKEKARKQHGGPIVLGSIKIEGEKLSVLVNSAKRAGRVRKLIERRLGTGAKFKATLIEDLESALNEHWQASVRGSTTGGGRGNLPDAGAGPEDEDGAFTSTSELPPEAQAMVKEFAQQHWANWYDQPIPALDGMTPREAAKSAEGRELLESLLLYYESQDARSNNNLMKADIPALRRELGMLN